MSAAGEETRSLRVGELAELTGTTPRTIRDWEDGLTADRGAGPRPLARAPRTARRETFTLY